jgi:tetratricopeptide (TPR) repeat protein
MDSSFLKLCRFPGRRRYERPKWTIINASMGHPSGRQTIPNIMRIFRVLILASLAVAVSNPALGAETYQVAGTILRENGKPFLRSRAVVFLHGAVKPYYARTEAALNGTFKFKNVPASTYILLVAMPQMGELQKTIEVGPGFADSKKRVELTITASKADAKERTHVVSAAELSIPPSAKEEYGKATACLARRDIQGAIACLKRATEIAPQFAGAWNLLGTIAHQTRQFAQAEEYFREALRRDAELYPPLVNLGGALLAQGKIEESLSVNLRAVAAGPRDALANTQLGLCYFYLGRLDDAEIYLKQAKTLDAGHFSCPQLYLAEIYASRGQTAAAISEIEEFLRLHPDTENASELTRL